MQRFFPTWAHPNRALWAAILTLFFAVVFGGCARPVLPRDTAVVLVEMPFRNIDPLKATDAVSQKIGNLIHLALVRNDTKMRMVPELAQSWKIDGYKRFHFKLNPGARFHDGSPVTAGDVVRCFDDYRKNSPHSIALLNVKRVWASSLRDVHVETTMPQPFLLNDLPVLKVFKRDSGGAAIGAGRYKLVRETANLIELERVKEFFEPAPEPGLSKINFRYVSDETTRYQLLVRGDGNVALSSLTPTKSDYLLKNMPPHLGAVWARGINVSYLSFNFRNPHLKNLKVRQALAHAVDAAEVQKHRIKTLGEVATGILSPALEEYYEPNVKTYRRNRKLAEKLLDEAGYPRRGRWRFPLTFKVTPEKFSYDLVTIIAAQLREVGIDARIRAVDAATFFADVKAGNFDLFHSRWIGVNNPSIYFRAFHSSQIGKFNRGAYVNSEMDKLIEQGMSETNDARRKEIFSRVQKLAAVDLPYINLWYWNNLLIGPSQMREVVMYPNGNYLTLAQLKL